MDTLRQLGSFGAIGIASNGALYVLYLALTAFGTGPKTAMTAVFALGVLATFALNRRWTFRHDGSVAGPAARYAGVYLLAYAANITALGLLVDVAGLPHQAVMLVLIVATAALVFVLQKFWVFSVKPTAQRSS
ncbi:MAG TPA: GtrA family protein [Gammaproteobacteria bacterium]|nr:GtrA family protein [Gammaproteobacteria bacterium]